MKTTLNGLILLFILITSTSFAEDVITLTTWNIEHLGSAGRGFGSGFCAGDLPKRSNAQLDQIAVLIKKQLGSDIIALQEIAIAQVEHDRSRSRQLDHISQQLGSRWQYYLPPIDESEVTDHDMVVGLMWNTQKVHAATLYTMDIPNLELAGASLFKRKPVIGYFEALKDNQRTNDFMVAVVHLKSGQHFDENHLIAMTVLEHGSTTSLKNNQIKESDRIILGNFNDNPYAKTAAGNQKYSQALYQHMAFKQYKNLVTSDLQYTRMNNQLDSIIDRILVNKSGRQHLVNEVVTKYIPDNAPDAFHQWRATFSDHFPLSIKIKVENRDDDADF